MPTIRPGSLLLTTGRNEEQWRSVSDGRVFSMGNTAKAGYASPIEFDSNSVTAVAIFHGKAVWATPTPANGRIYCRHHENLLYLNVRGFTV